MRRGSFLGWGVALVTLTTSAGCKENETGVAGQAPEGLTKLAMGAFFPVTVEDACRGGGKLNPCTTQVVTKVNRVSVSGGVTAHAIEEVPEAMREPNVLAVVRGSAPFRGSAVVEATFDDGSVRTASYAFWVVFPTEARPGVPCSGGNDGKVKYFTLGESTTIALDLLSGGSLLEGAVPGALSGAGLVQVSGLRKGRYSWRAPDTAQKVRIQSSGVPSFDLELASYGPADASLGEARLEQPSKAGLLRGVTALIRVPITVGGVTPCSYVPLEASTNTPAVCLGPGNAQSWQELASGSVRIIPVGAGTCRLSVGIQGAATRRDIEVRYELQP